MFNITSAADFYAMLIQDFDDFMEEPHSARRALHCAITAYHLHEWVWGDLVKRKKSMRETFKLTDSTSFLEWICGQSIWFEQVQALANGTKHFARDQGFETTRVMVAPFAFDQLHAGLDEGAWDGPIRYVRSEHPIGPKGQGYLLIDYGEAPSNHLDDAEACEAEDVSAHRFMTAAALLEVVLRFWRDFFRIHFPEIKVLVSPHHPM